MMRPSAPLVVAGVLAVAAAVGPVPSPPLAAQDTVPAEPSPYAVLTDRQIKALSPGQIEEYLSGAGMGLALAAELNGLPGPRHVLDLADRLGLTGEQQRQARAIFDRMLAEAIHIGTGIVARERELDALFAMGSPTPDTVRARAVAIGRLRGELRAVHLLAHVAMMDVLTPDQVRAYNALRGYHEGGHGDGHDHGQHASGAGSDGARAGASPFVFVHGAWGGGWAWRAVDSLLATTGHRATRPTLTGLGERAHLADPGIGLATHVEDVVNHLRFERLDDVILVGHSYGGMVAMGVADRVPERIRRVVLLDAFLPEDGESVVTASDGTGVEAFIHGLVAAAGTGPIVPSWVEAGAAMPTDVPQPLRTFTEPIRLARPSADGAGVPGTYILTVEPGAARERDAFAAFADRARVRGWDVVVLRADHNPQRTARTELVELLERLARPAEPAEQE